MKKRWNILDRWFSNIPLIVAGTLGTIIGIADMFFDVNFIPFVKDPQGIVLVIVSLLALGLGIERRAGFETLIHDLKKVENVLRSAVPFRVLIGESAVFEEATHAVRKCGDADVIRATGLAPSKDGAEERQYIAEYLSAIVERICQAKNRGGMLSYRWVIADVESGRKKQILRKRLEAFANNGILDRFLVREFTHTWPMEMLIAGDIVVIGFSGLTAGALTFRAGISITDPRFAWHLAQWYDDFLWTGSQVFSADEV